MVPQAESVDRMSRPVGRLAPSPTGRLHLGNARTFLLAWLSIRQQKGHVILRIEDIDAARVKPGATESVLSDLRWLGLDWDSGPDISSTDDCPTPLLQSQRMPRYREILERLILDGQVYACTCTRRQIAQLSASAPHEPGLASLDGPVYPGTCRESLTTDGTLLDQLPDERIALRWAFAEGVARWEDQLLGLQTARPLQQLGDFVIARGNWQPSYQLAVVVDDHDQQVSEVVRGEDLLLSTFRQLAILEHLGWQIPNYYHVPLMLDASGQRMAKRKGDSLEYLRARGTTPEAVVGYLSHSLGLIDRQEPSRPCDLIGSLDWSRLSPQTSLLPDWLQ